MRKIIFIVVLVFSTFTALYAQDGEKIQALKIAFITQKLELTTDEAQKFWPVYNQYEGEIRGTQAINNGNALESEEKLLNIRKKYKPSFEKVIGQQKLNKLFNAEKDFRTVLIHRLKDRAPQRLNKIRR
jgi:hypothetical protein